MKQNRPQRKQEKALRRKHRQEQARPRAPMSRFSSQDALRQMASEMQNNALLPGLTPVINPPGQEKVSDVIWQYQFRCDAL